MTQNPSSFLPPWTGFYTMTGTAAATLIGLMFVVVTLVAGTQRMRSREGTGAFSTPTLVHFGGALLVSAVLCAPWRLLLYPCIIIGLAALYGIAYVLFTARRIRRMDGYTADTEDWAWHVLLPLLSYGVILAGTALLPVDRGQALFAPAGAVVLMLFIGIHNAWDIVTYLAVVNPEADSTGSDGPKNDGARPADDPGSERAAPAAQQR